jgi:hypothetical protein
MQNPFVLDTEVKIGLSVIRVFFLIALQCMILFLFFSTGEVETLFIIYSIILHTIELLIGLFNLPIGSRNFDGDSQ